MICFETREGQRWFFMEEQYKGHVIRVTTEKDNSAFPWKPICSIPMERRESLLNNVGLMLGSDQAKQLLVQDLFC
jgi:hypothetical protein